MSLLEEIRQIRLCLPAFPRGSCVYLLTASPHRSHCRAWLSFSSLLSSKEMLWLSSPACADEESSSCSLRRWLTFVEEKRKKCLHPSSWRACYWKDCISSGDHSTLTPQRWERSTDLQKHSTGWWSMGFSFVSSWVSGDIKKRGKPVFSFSEAWTQQDVTPACRRNEAAEVDDWSWRL